MIPFYFPGFYKLHAQISRFGEVNVDDSQCAASVLSVLCAILHTNYLSIICFPSVASWFCLFFQVFIPENSFLLCSLMDMISFHPYTEWKAFHSLLTMEDNFAGYFSLGWQLLSFRTCRTLDNLLSPYSLLSPFTMAYLSDLVNSVNTVLKYSLSKLQNHEEFICHQKGRLNLKVWLSLLNYKVTAVVNGWDSEHSFIFSWAKFSIFPQIQLLLFSFRNGAQPFTLRKTMEFLNWTKQNI